MSRARAAIAAATLAAGLTACRPPTPPAVVDVAPALGASTAAVASAVDAATIARTTALDAAVAARIERLNAATDAIEDALRVVRDASPPFDAVIPAGADPVERSAAALAIADEALGRLAVEARDAAALRDVDVAARAVLGAADRVVHGWDTRAVDARAADWAALQQAHATWRDALRHLGDASPGDPWATWLGSE